jgi:hypothetical protein
MPVQLTLQKRTNTSSPGLTKVSTEPGVYVVNAVLPYTLVCIIPGVSIWPVREASALLTTRCCSWALLELVQ